jgi:hypothetical protein
VGSIPITRSNSPGTNIDTRLIPRIFAFGMSPESHSGGEPGLNNSPNAPTGANALDSKSPAHPLSSEPAPKVAAPSQKPTADEQMALYEDDLKNSDWGHQPC